MFSSEFAIETKVHNVPRKEEATQFKSKALRGSFDWPWQVLGFVTWGETFWKIGMTDINEFLKHSMTNSWSNQAYAQGFECECIALKKDVNIFEHMEIVESVV